MYCNTSQGLKEKSSLVSLKFLSHEHLFQNLSRFCSKSAPTTPLSISDINIWRKNVFSFTSNVILNDIEELLTELKPYEDLSKLCIV